MEMAPWKQVKDHQFRKKYQCNTRHGKSTWPLLFTTCGGLLSDTRAMDLVGPSSAPSRAYWYPSMTSNLMALVHSPFHGDALVLS